MIACECRCHQRKFRRWRLCLACGRYEGNTVENEIHTNKAKRLVFEYAERLLEKTDETQFTWDDVYVVWFTYILGNWKALVSTTLPDGMYYEVTHNAAKHETYVDVYKKFDNVCVPDGPLEPSRGVVSGNDGPTSLIMTSKYNPAGPDRFA